MEAVSHILLYAGIGVISGLLAGILGIGGGMVTVPCLFFLFSHIDIPHAEVMQLAIGTSLAAMTLNTSSSVYAQHGRGMVLWDLVKKASLGVVIGGLLGVIIAKDLSEGLLEIIFGIFLSILGIFFFLRINPSFKKCKIPSNPLFSFLFLAIGAISSILGIGGGVFTAPLLIAFQTPQKVAIGTTSALTCIMTFVGAFGFLVLGNKGVQIPGSIGYVHIIAFLVIGIVSFFFAPIGVKIGHRLPDHIVSRIFGTALIGTALLMLA